MNKTELKPCPFCGFQPHLEAADCCYPVTRNRDLYGIHCYETGGGCSAQVLGDSVEECISKWNKRWDKCFDSYL